MQLMACRLKRQRYHGINSLRKKTGFIRMFLRRDLYLLFKLKTPLV